MNQLSSKILLFGVGAVAVARGSFAERAVAQLPVISLRFTDARADASVHRSDPASMGPIGIPPGRVLPDLLGMTVTGWISSAPTSDPYAGRVPVIGETYHLLRIQVDFAGLVNPPGPLGIGGGVFNPLKHGHSPLYAFMDFDVDRDVDTGGELGAEALAGFTANACRFGSLPPAPLDGRAALAGLLLDGDFFTSPHFERSGSDWTLALCGCDDIAITARLTGDADDQFEAGEDWIISGRFFRRAGGYREGSSVFGGSQLGAYDPVVKMRFAHVQGMAGDGAAGRTVLILVYPLDMTGAAALAGGPNAQPPDQDVSNETSVLEGISDLIDGANSGVLVGPNAVLQSRWAGRSPSAYLNPLLWRVTAIGATAYPDPRPFLYVYTDIGFDETFGDVNADRAANNSDQAAISSFITTFDGSIYDLDGAANGRFVVQDFGPNFIVYDLDNDGDVDQLDAGNAVFVPPQCPGDLNQDGAVNTQDLTVLLAHFGMPAGTVDDGDINGDGVVNTSDLTLLLGAFGNTCP